jgi:hypothetical protein
MSGKFANLSDSSPWFGSKKVTSEISQDTKMNLNLESIPQRKIVEYEKDIFRLSHDSSHGCKISAHARLVCFLLSFTFLLVIWCCDDDASGVEAFARNNFQKKSRKMIHFEARPAASQLSARSPLTEIYDRRESCYDCVKWVIGRDKLYLGHTKHEINFFSLDRGPRENQWR